MKTKMKTILVLIGLTCFTAYFLPMSFAQEISLSGNVTETDNSWFSPAKAGFYGGLLGGIIGILGGGLGTLAGVLGSRVKEKKTKC
ncbi:MAG: hypothetical protein LBT05_02365 [Planctomycetaceae bacterium]|jgi:hypothetical protein|nr:hypothetical protein [Planctomycetaceae bacterium]